MGTFGNVSGVDRAAGVFVIKPSGVPYEELTAGHDGAGIARDRRGRGGHAAARRPTRRRTSSCTAPSTAAASSTRHSEYATVFAQARTPIRCLGTTHADHFRGDVPVTRAADPRGSGGGVRSEHGPRDRRDVRRRRPVSRRGARRCWSRTTRRSRGAAMRRRRSRTRACSSSWRAWSGAARVLAPDAPRPDAFLVDKHYLRKHGKSAYYGQTK